MIAISTARDGRRVIGHAAVARHTPGATPGNRGFAAEQLRPMAALFDPAAGAAGCAEGISRVVALFDWRTVSVGLPMVV